MEVNQSKAIGNLTSMPKLSYLHRDPVQNGKWWKSWIFPGCPTKIEGQI